MMADRVSELMQERLGGPAGSLTEQLGRNGPYLPRRLRRKARFLADSAEHAKDPRTLPGIDEAEVAAAYDDCLRYLKRLGPLARLRARLGGGVWQAAKSLVIFAALVALFLIWRGLV